MFINVFVRFTYKKVSKTDFSISKTLDEINFIKNKKCTKVSLIVDNNKMPLDVLINSSIFIFSQKIFKEIFVS